MTDRVHMLDTDTASYLIKGHSDVARSRFLAVQPSPVCISAITYAEIVYGLMRLSARHWLHVAVRAFLDDIPTLPWDVRAADAYAPIRHNLKTKGRLIGELDVQIAAHAVSVGAILVTNNLRHYQRIEAPLLLENWLEDVSSS